MSLKPHLVALAFLLAFPITGNTQNQKNKAPAKPKAAAAAKPAAPDKVTRYYHIPKTFTIPQIQDGKTGMDPFSEVTLEPGAAARQTLRLTFLRAGIELNTDDSVSYDAPSKILTATTSVRAHSQMEDYFAKLERESEKQFHILIEYIEVDHIEFSDWLLENRISGDGTPLRKEVQEWAREERATILQSVMVTARSGQRAKVESVSEYTYPTEYNPPAIPNQLTQGKDSEVPFVGIAPTAFETRNLGVTLEVDPVLGRDEITIDLNLAPEITELEGETTWSNEEMDENLRASFPTFYTMKTTTQVTLHDGQYAFLSTMRPLKSSTKDRADALVLLFARADIGNLGAWSVKEKP